MDDAAEPVLRDVIRVARDAFGDRLVAGYAMGSLAHGGFSPLVSDVDVALILADPIQPTDDDLIAGVTDRVRAFGTVLHSRVSIFWGTPESLAGDTDRGRFPPLDRLCLFEHGRLLCGNDIRASLSPPGRTELIVAGARFSADLLSEAVVAAATDPAGLLARGLRSTTKMVLFPVRFLFTADTGREGTNHAAVEHYSAHRSGPATDLVAAAFSWRTDPPAGQQAATLLDEGFVALYDDYLADHVERLRAAGEPELADRFSRWRSRMLEAS